MTEITGEALQQLVQQGTMALLELMLPVWILLTSVFITFAIFRSLAFVIKKMV